MKVTRTFRIHAGTLRKVESLAVAENRNLNNMVETILKSYAARERAKAESPQGGSATEDLRPQSDGVITGTPKPNPAS